MTRHTTPRAARLSTNLTPEMAGMVKGMLARGDRQSDISSFFQINQGRIHEIKTGQRFRNVPATQETFLPERGPYVVVSQVRHERAATAEATLAKIMGIMERATSDIRSQVGAALTEDVH